MIENLLSIGETAEFLKVDRSTLWRWQQSGKIEQPKTVAGHPVYERSYLEKFAESLRAEAATSQVQALSA